MQFVRWYNEDHQHSSIRFVTPAQRHDGRGIAILAERREVYEAARRPRPERWSRKTQDWTRPAVVTLNPATRRIGPAPSTAAPSRESAAGSRAAQPASLLANEPLSRTSTPGQSHAPTVAMP
jgi:hypothetical protein